MHIEERKVTVREVIEGYFNDAEEGVVGYYDGEEYDISEIVPHGSPDAVEVRLVQRIRLQPCEKLFRWHYDEPQAELVAELHCQVIEHEVVVPELVENNPFSQKAGWLSQVLSRF